MTGKEIVSTEPRKAYLREYEDVPVKENEIRVKVEFAAAKHGTEFTHFRGEDPFLENIFDEEYLLFRKSKEAAEKPFFMRPGNMWIGHITEMGKEVKGFEIGERIAGYGPLKSTHTLKAEEAFKMPKRMTWKEAVCYDPAQFALGGIRDGQVRVGDNVVISGLGAIGLLAAQYEELEHPVRIGQRVVIGAVLHRDESLAPHIEPSLLLDLLDGVGPNGLVLVDPASGQ